MNATYTPIILREYEPRQLPRDAMTAEQGELLWSKFGNEITVTEPSFRTKNQWELVSQGWVGYIPLAEDLHFYLEPKVPLYNLFGMWDYAYHINWRSLPGWMNCDSLQKFYQQLARVLAKGTMARGRKGYYRSYVPRSEDLAYLRGKLDLTHMLAKPWEPSPRCHFHEHTADVVENQLLAWALHTILQSGYCSEDVLLTLRSSYRNIIQAVSLQPFCSQDCVNRTYNRLNQDYQPLHALCRFFLANTGPSYHLGDRTMLPFLFDMGKLFELFVAEWLRVNIPYGYAVVVQEPIAYGELNQISSNVDLVIYRTDSRQAVCVLDTKYKNPDSPAPADIHQIHYYATVKGCHDAVLVYPTLLPKPIDTPNEQIRIHSAVFSLDGDLEQAGEVFLSQLALPELAGIESSRSC